MLNLTKEPVDIKKCKKALSNFIHGKFRMSVPPEPDDDDILLHNALNELEQLRKYMPTKEEAMAAYVEMECVYDDEESCAGCKVKSFCEKVKSNHVKSVRAKLKAYIESEEAEKK